MEDTADTMTIASRSDFALWTIKRAKTILAVQGADLLAARDQGDDRIAQTANAMGQAIVDALLEVFDSMVEA